MAVPELGRIRLAVWVLAGAVGIAMPIVCANLSSLRRTDNGAPGRVKS